MKFVSVTHFAVCRLTVACCLALLPALGISITEEQARQRARHYAALLGVSLLDGGVICELSAGPVATRYWLIQARETIIAIDDSSGELRLALDGERDRQIRKRIGRTGHQFFPSM